MYPDASTTEIRDALSKSNNSISMSKPILERLGHVNKKQTGKAPPAEKTAYGARVNYVPCYIQTATTSGKIATTSGKTATTSGKTATTSGKTATTSGKTATTSGKTTARTVKTTPPVVKTA
uniref:Uncharacterized protein n=1 Tax=Ciona savignyi TaxID=51511 RepID=H2YFZ8_CIOSA